MDEKTLTDKEIHCKGYLWFFSALHDDNMMILNGEAFSILTHCQLNFS